MAALGSHIFGSLLRARERAYASGRLGVARLPAPAISVGNLRVGGSGKTPAVIAIGQELGRRGIAFDVLSRGYRRSSRRLEIAQRGDESVDEVGDEPRLIAQKLQAPVLVYPDRFRAGLEGERRFHSQLHLLDDGFQHRQLARAFDLVLVAPSDLDDRLLPAGRLREPATALARADAVLWVAATDSAQGRFDPGRELQTAQRRLQPWTPAPVYVARKRAAPLTQLPKRPYAFCGLARPESFWETLSELHIEIVGREAYRDHHRYRTGDLRRLRTGASAAGAESFVTTAKDVMNLPGGSQQTTLTPLHVIEIEMEIPEMKALIGQALSACGLA